MSSTGIFLDLKFKRKEKKRKKMKRTWVWSACRVSEVLKKKSGIASKPDLYNSSEGILWNGILVALNFDLEGVSKLSSNCVLLHVAALRGRGYVRCHFERKLSRSSRRFGVLKDNWL